MATSIACSLNSAARVRKANRLVRHPTITAPAASSVRLSQALRRTAHECAFAGCVIAYVPLLQSSA